MGETTEKAMTTTSLDVLPKIAEGKVRDLYEVDEKTLLFVASDRISAYDVIMENGVPYKGVLLTLLSAHWFAVLPTLIPGLNTHFITTTIPSSIPSSLAAPLKNRSMVVRKLKIFPLEAIVRGYLTGSAWKEYQRTSTIHSIALPPNLQNCQALPTPLYTPSTKAPAGQNDENISPAQAIEIVGPKYAARIEELSLQLYKVAAAYAFERGIIIADTKFEFGLDEESGEVVLVDEVLTPDSSRFWPKEKYEVGREQESFDKQYLRDWLVGSGKKGVQGVSMPEEVVRGTTGKYREAFEKLVGKGLEEIIGV